ncbi:Major facilitator superfamily domain, general substrate transporter [Metarhizium album ARSEF 1941]|uniref:Major facilitator superfamily domain, general substrate transporter n=1 Tax=Metarhizium album (strain ARSEF 1941) TaxID=1081103 RepID=A0A0B2WU04_METAS|nr:Major facilitator superfamily domain, general substrate transporter [Metarhizium album ARSEF 1941]KHN96400.1 Major facilitator superfamily domain, general substrate transporter [Metarhizium album ARSEF 1941]
MENISQASPLLPPVSGRHDEATQTKRDKTGAVVVVVRLLLYTTFLDLSFWLMEPAQTRIFERIYCREYYLEHEPSLIGSDGRRGVDEKWCKVSWVQAEVAFLKGWQLTLDSIGMLAFSIPWGYAADSYGRKPVLLLVSMAILAKHSYVQFISYLDGAVPLKWVWLSALHTVFGGGVPVSAALTHTIVSDVVAERNRVTIFFQLMAASITAEFLGSLAAAALMVWNPWIPMILAVLIKIAGIIILLFIPETLSPGPAAPRRPVMPAEEADSGRWCCQSALGRFLSSMAFLISDVRLLLIISPFLIHLLFSNEEILRLYISAHYGQTLAHATVIISIRSGCVLFLNVLILPVLSTYCRRLWGPRRSDLLLTRASAAFLAFGLLGVGVARTQPLLISALLVNSLGWGLFSFVRSLATALVEKRDVARLNSVIGVFDIVGRIAGSPVLAFLFARGVEMGGTWAGLPFISCSGIVMVLLLGLTQVSV